MQTIGFKSGINQDTAAEAWRKACRAACGLEEPKSSTPKLDEARRRWGTARVLTGTPTPTTHTPAPAAPAVAMKEVA